MWQNCNKIGFEPVLKVSDVPQIMTANAIQRKYSRNGFTLIELLAVMAVVILMSALMLPSITGMQNSAGRRGAVTTIMNTFEQARVAALESGATVYVVFSRPDFPDQDAIMVVRETADPAAKYEQLTKWIKLPKGILLHTPRVGDSFLSADQSTSGFDASRMPLTPLPSATANGLKVMAFNDQGAVYFPVGKTFRKLIVSEGVRGTGGTEALIGDKKQATGGFEIISVAQYTGRAQLDVSTLQ
ncbi:hypothetical protein BH09VER1_BH09VER1_41360 [soil metagenome]